jgi:hypothetical protein
MALLNMRGGVTDSNTKALDQRLWLFPDAKVQRQFQFKTNHVIIDTSVNPKREPLHYRDGWLPG